MRARTLVALVLVASSVATTAAVAQTTGDGLVPGDYLRISGGMVKPIHPSGSLKDWKGGQGVNVMWENWDNGQMGLSRIAFGLYGDLSLLPFDDQQFIAEFRNGPNGAVRTAKAARARVIQIGVNTRLRIPVSFITPSISLGFGFLDWHPAQIDYTAVNGQTGTAKQQSRQGGVVTVIGGLDKHIFDRFTIFGEAAYAYGYTSFGGSLAASGSACVTTDCDLLKNTPLGIIRAGLRVRANR